MRGSSAGSQKLVATSKKQKKKGTRAWAGVDQDPCYKGKKKLSARQPAVCDEEGDTSASDDHVVLALSGQMVEESRKRKAGQQQCDVDHPAAVLNGLVAGRQDAFAAFATQYKDALRFVDAEEAEAVYSMVALTQARGPAWPQPKLQAPAAAEEPEGHAAKRQQLAARQPAAPACSEGGSSDSSAKSAPLPSPAGQQQQQQQHGMAPAPGPYFPGCVAPGPMAPGQLQAQSMQAHAAARQGGAGVGASCAAAACSMPMAPGFFPPGYMVGAPPGAPGCLLPPFLPPWALPPAMVPMLFGGMGMFGPMPPNSPALMALAPPGMAPPGMPVMPPACMPGMHMASAPLQTAGGGAQPAAGIPVSGARQPSHGDKAAAAAQGQRPHSQHGQGQQGQPAVAGSPEAAGAAADLGGAVELCPDAGGSSNKPSARNTSPAIPAAHVNGTAHSPSAQQQQQQAGLHAELQRLDVASLKPWVLRTFCEDVYLLLLDVWRPGSGQVEDALWAWKLHVGQPRRGGAPPDYRAFLVSLFGLEKLAQLTAADRARGGAGCGAAAALPAPAPVLARQGTGGHCGSSSAGDGAMHVAAAGRSLAVAGGVAVGAAALPAAAGMALQHLQHVPE